MKVQSCFTEIPNHFIKNAARWVESQTGVKLSTRIKSIEIGEADLNREWRWSFRSGDLKIKFSEIYIRYWVSKDRTHADKIEAIVFFVAWAILQSDGRAKTRSRVNRIMKLFDEAREDLVVDWYCPPRGS
jgi:hypothetical protein